LLSFFFCFNSLGDSIFDTFQSRASKFEDDLLISYDNTKDSLINKFDGFATSRSFVSKFKVMSQCITAYLSTFTNYHTFKLFSLFLSSTFAKLSELILFETKLVTAFQEKCVSLLLYPLVFQTTKSNIALLSSVATKAIIKQPIATKVNILCSISK
jgi:hypothetical protein